MKTTDEKWKMVPVEPTPEMWKAGTKRSGIEASQAALCWADMLAAAPTPPQDQPEAVEPVAWMIDGRIEQGLSFDKKAAETMADANCGTVKPLFTLSPTATQALRMAAVSLCDLSARHLKNGDIELGNGVNQAANYVCSLIPPTSEQDSAAQSASESDQRKLGLCPHCNGSGEEVHSACIGPDSYEELGNCSKCGGTGDIKDAYANALVSLEKAQVENMQLRANAYLTPPTDTVTMTRESGVLDEVLAEVEKAIRKFPTWPTDPLHAFGVLSEEYGELAKDVLQQVYEPQKTNMDNIRKEAVQTAAMALRFLNSLDEYKFIPGEQHKQRAIVAQHMPKGEK